MASNRVILLPGLRRHPDPEWARFCEHVVVAISSESNNETLVVVIEDDDLVQRALIRLLRTAQYVVQAFSSVEAYLERHAWDPPACLVLDLHLPASSGIELLEQMQRDNQFVPAIVITAHGNIPTTVQAMKAGAFEFLEKPFDNHQLLAAVAEGVERGRSWRRDQGHKTDVQARLAQLTPRERQVLELVVEGLPNKRIAARFQISEKTIKVHRARVMEKMGATSLAELVRLVALGDISSIVAPKVASQPLGHPSHSGPPDRS